MDKSNIKKNVLIIEDDAQIGNLLLESLEINGYRAVLVNNGKALKSIVDIHKYELFVIDIFLPDINGCEIIDFLKPLESSYEVIVITGYEKFDVVKKLLKLGVYECLIKPFDMVYFITCVNRAFKKIKNNKIVKYYVDNYKVLEQKYQDQLNFISKITENERDKVNLILNTLDQGLMLISAENIIIYINKKAEDIFGIKFSESIGCDLFKMVNDMSFLNIIRQNDFIAKYGSTYFNKSNKTYEVKIFPINNQELKNIGNLIYLTDKTEEENAANLRKNLLSIVAHELRTPLTVLSNDMFVINNQLGLNDKKLVENAKAAIKKLNSTINSLIEVAKFSDTKISLNYEKTNIENIINIQKDALIKQIEEQSIDYKLENNLNSNDIFVDSEKFSLALYCIIENALKFNYKNGYISIRLFEDDGNIIIKIRNSGCGINKKKIDKIFNNFFQLESHLVRYHGGMGTGLYIAQKIISQLSGNLKVETKENFWAEFQIYIPKIKEIVR